VEVVVTSQAGAQARWSTLKRPAQGFTLEQVRALGRDAVRMCEGFEFRYHREGRITWFGRRGREELDVVVPETVPRSHWQHLPGCGCEACRERD
jgi:hypothetical protein